MPNCKVVNKKLVCGMLHSGGTANKSGVYRLAKGEKVFTKGQMHNLTKGTSSKSTKTKKKCKCKKH